MLHRTCLILLALLAGNIACADTLPMDTDTVHSLHELCISKNMSQYALCAGYVNGINDALTSIGTMCPEDNVTRGQLIAVFVQWHDTNPKLWNKFAYTGVAAAFKDAWPCKR